MNKGKLGNQKRQETQKIDQGFLNQEKRIFGRISRVFTENGTWIKPLVQVRYEENSTGPVDPGHSGIIGDENTWIPLGNDPLDIALRFGEPQPGDRVEIRYNKKPWLGKAYIVEEDRDISAYGAAEIGQSNFIIFSPGD
jgi:hypothetical protein